MIFRKHHFIFILKLLPSFKFSKNYFKNLSKKGYFFVCFAKFGSTIANLTIIVKKNLIDNCLKLISDF